MNNPNPFVPKGSLLEQQNKRRAHMKLGVLCGLSVGVAGLMVMLIQGCKKSGSDTGSEVQTGGLDATNPVPAVDTNPAPIDVSNSAPFTPSTNAGGVTPPLPISTAPPAPQLTQPPQPPVVTPPTQVAPTGVDTGSAEYTVAKGDSLAKIAKKNGVSLKALEAANPDAKPTKLKVGQKLIIPAGGKSVAEAQSAAPVADTATTPSTATYTVKSGDTLHKIAKAHHVSVKALMAANGMTTTQIKVGKKLKLPAKAEAAVAQAPVEPAPTTDATLQAPPVPQPVLAAPAPSNTGAPVPH